MSNRLAASTSPYLQQHADNPVDWYPWGEEAFAAARSRDVPILLSIGYSACHWCHVMAHESFEDEATAAELNAGFVPVKVDREERPDVDAVYMAATQAMTGQGGWPMTVVVTPAGEPFFAGTYFPPEPRHGMPAFRQVLAAVRTAWRDRRADLQEVGAEVVKHLEAASRQPAVERQSAGEHEPTDAETWPRVSDEAVGLLAREYDERRGGFGTAPKFPPSMVLEFLLRRGARTGDDDALAMAASTFEAMARGGIYDQLGGGFARYSVDAEWRVPHFEKMLYDNSLLLSGYLHWWRLTGTVLGERVARETAEFMLRELRTPRGGFASALDADSDGHEGAFYVWTRDDLRAALGADVGAAAAETFAVEAQGPVDGASTLRLQRDPVDSDAHRALSAALLAVRERRPRPGRDDKVVAAWNGLAIGALAEAGELLGESRFLTAARECAQELVDVHLRDGGGLSRVSRDGAAGTSDGVLEDYACLAEGLLSLYAATGETTWFEHAAGLVDQVRGRFADGEGGYFDTASDAEPLVTRPRDPADNATPSGQAATASVLITLAALTGDGNARAEAELVVRRLTGLARRAPRFAGKALSAVEALLDGPRQVAVVGSDGDPARNALLAAAFRLPYPGLAIAQGDGRTAGIPLLEGRPLVDGRAAAYLCHDFICDLPVTEPGALTHHGVDHET